MLINIIINDKDKFVLDIDAMKPISHVYDTIRSGPYFTFGKISITDCGRSYDLKLNLTPNDYGVKNGDTLFVFQKLK